jgi:hypothetical protein
MMRLARSVDTLPNQASVSPPVGVVTEGDSVCTSVIETKMKKKMYSIVSNFVGISGYPNEPGQFISSPIVEEGWSLRIYPGGLDENSNGFLSCYVAYEFPGSARAAFKISIINQNGWKNKEYVQDVKTFLQQSETEQITNKPSNVWGDTKFISKNDLQFSDNGIIVNDSLAIKVDLVVYGDVEQIVKSQTMQWSSVPVPLPLASKSQLSTPSKNSSAGHLVTSMVSGSHSGSNEHSLYSDLAAVYASSSMADVAIIVQDEKKDEVDRIGAHQFVLCLRSPVFKAMFVNGHLEAESSEIVVTDFPASVVKSMLQYMYTDSCSGIDMGAYGEQLLAIASKYQISGLVAICEHYLCSTINYNNVANMLFIADLFCAYRLKAHALNFISHHTKSVITPGNGAQFFENLNFQLCQDVIKALAGIHIDTPRQVEDSECYGALHSDGLSH